MRRSFLVFSFAIFSFLSEAYSYQVQDIQKLLSERKFSEAYAYLNDIPPTQRDKPWEQILSKATVEYANALEKNEVKTTDIGNTDVEKTDILDARALVHQALKDYPFLSSDPTFQKEFVRITLAAVQKDPGIAGYSGEKRDLIDEVTKVDESAIYPLVLNAGVTDDRGILIRYISKNREKYKKDEKVAKYLVNAEVRCLHDPKDQEFSKSKKEIHELIVFYHLQPRIDEIENKAKKESNQEEQNFLDSIARGELNYKNQSLGNMLVDFHNDFKKNHVLPKDQNLALYLVSGLVYTVGQLNKRMDDHVVGMLNQMSKVDIEKAEQTILQATHPTQKWFTSFDDEQHYRNLEKFVPKILAKIMSEYEILKKNPNKKSDYLSTYGVKKIDEILKIRK